MNVGGPDRRVLTFQQDVPVEQVGDAIGEGVCVLGENMFLTLVTDIFVVEGVRYFSFKFGQSFVKRSLPSQVRITQLRVFKCVGYQADGAGGEGHEERTRIVDGNARADQRCLVVHVGKFPEIAGADQFEQILFFRIQLGFDRFHERIVLDFEHLGVAVVPSGKGYRVPVDFVAGVQPRRYGRFALFGLLLCHMGYGLLSMFFVDILPMSKARGFYPLRHRNCASTGPLADPVLPLLHSG